MKERLGYYLFFIVVSVLMISAIIIFKDKKTVIYTPVKDSVQTQISKVINE